jgi:ribosomal protein L9
MSKANKKQVEALARVREQREQSEFAEANQLREQLSKIAVVLAVKTGENGKMFGSATPADICHKIAEGGIEIDKRKLSLVRLRKWGAILLKSNCIGTLSSIYQWRLFLKIQSTRSWLIYG